MSAALEALEAARGPCALLESTGGAPRLARFSLLAHDPVAVLVAGRDEACLEWADGRQLRAAGSGAFTLLRRLLAELPARPWPQGGAIVGALAYDWARPARPADEGPLLVALGVERFQLFTVEHDPASSSPRLSEPLIDLEPCSSFSREAYCRGVARVQEHIAAGDVYQANLAQRFELDLGRLAPGVNPGLALYGALRVESPAPFAGYLRAGGLEIVSASPERLLEVEGASVSTRPIAGTRPRALADADDASLGAELLLSEKERAEHLMLVDLARNDLGQVAEIGSVEVDELMTVESYAQVRHIASNVRARLAPGRDAFDALLALFPGGTITGVPKQRCMQILDALEPVPRGFYTGALFYATPGGRLDANILIRSAVVSGGRVRFQTGAGIVADSDPRREYEETLHKAVGLRRALERVLGHAATEL